MSEDYYDDDERRSDRGRRDDNPRPRSSGGDSGVKIVLIILGVVFLVGFCLVGSFVGGMYLLLRGATQQVQQAVALMETENNYKQVGLAMHNYHDTHQKFPPVSLPTTDGKPGLSWRVALLPYLEEQALYDQFKLDRGWEDPENMRLAARMPRVFSQRGVGGDRTHMRLFVGPRAIFDPNAPPKSMATIADGTSNTLMVVEAADPVLWIKPEELTFDPKGPVPPLGLKDNEFFTALFADGDVRQIRKTMNPEKIKLLIDTADGQFVIIDE